MCWVIPPASPAATSVFRIASSSEVLPWSTWPMIVTTGGRSTSSSSGSSNTGSATVSSSEWTTSTFLPSSAASTWIASSDSVVVSVFISPSAISCFMTSGTGTSRYSATSLTVDPELIRIASVSASAVARRTRLGLFVVDAPATAAATLAARRLVGLRGRAAGVAARSLRVDHHAPPTAGVAGRALALERVAGGALVLGLAAGRSVLAAGRSAVAAAGRRQRRARRRRSGRGAGCVPRGSARARCAASARAAPPARPRGRAAGSPRGASLRSAATRRGQARIAAAGRACVACAAGVAGPGRLVGRAGAPPSPAGSRGAACAAAPASGRHRVAVAVAEDPRACASSTDEDAAFTSRPAALSRSSTSLGRARAPWRSDAHVCSSTPSLGA